MHSSPRPSIAIIGAGPRGTSLLERLSATLSHPDQDPSFNTSRGLDVHVIDDAPSGAGRIWRANQPRDLCMNTLADAVTLFTEPGSTVQGPIIEGPTLYEWGVLALLGSGSAGSRAVPEIPAARVAGFAQHPVREGFVNEYRAELEAMRPESHPSRAFYGEYLAWCFERAIARLPRGVRVIRHDARVVGIARDVQGSNGPQEAAETPNATAASDARAAAGAQRERLSLSDGSSLEADSVVLATGWMPAAETPAETELAALLTARQGGASVAPRAESPGAPPAPSIDSGQPAPLVWVRPESPIEQDLSQITPGSSVIMRGLGMSFFDTLSLLTLGRGGEFVADPAAPGGLRYLPSGEEPIVYATSHRGVPFRSKSLYGGLPPRAEQRFLHSVDWNTVPRPINFDRLLWPRIVADAFYDHALTLARVRPAAVTDEGTLPRVKHALEAAIDLLTASVDAEATAGGPSGTTGPTGPAGPTDHSAHDRAAAAAGLRDTVTQIAAAVAPFIPEPAERFDLAGEIDLASGQFASPAEFDAWVQARVAADLHEAELAIDSPLKAGLWSLSAARAASSRIGTLGGFDAESRASGMGLLFRVGGMVGSGPPAFRNRQLLALCAAGLVRFIGPQATVKLGATEFEASSPSVTGSEVTAPALVDAWMHFHSLDATADPLALSLLQAGRARSFRVATRQVTGDAGTGDGAPTSLPTGGFDVDPASGLLVGADGSLDTAVHVAGIPADQTLHDTVISPMPGTDPPMLRETDRVARSAIRIALASHPTPAAPHTASIQGALRV